MKIYRLLFLTFLVVALAAQPAMAQQKKNSSEISRTSSSAKDSKSGKDSKSSKDSKSGKNSKSDDKKDDKKSKKKKNQETDTVVAPVPETSRLQCVSIDSMMNHIRELGSSRYSGRLAGTTDYSKACEYVASTLESYGFEPYLGEWYEHFAIECNIIENCKFNSYVEANGVRTPYVLGKDFVCAGMTGRGYANAPVVFCGYGLDALAFNEYANVDAQGKVVLVLDGVPDFLPKNIVEPYYSMRAKAAVAKKHGACALVVIDLTKGCEHEVHGTVYSGGEPHMATFPIVVPHRTCASHFFDNELMSLQQAIDTIQSTRTPHSFHLRRNFEIDVNANYHPKAGTANVTAFLRGSDDKMNGEILVLGAHMDHVGLQGETCLFPGADNTLTGVAAVLEAARLMATNEDFKPKRSVLVVIFSGGESLCLGSRIFVSNANHKHFEAFLNPEALGSGDSLLVRGNAQFPLLYGVADSLDKLYTNVMVRGYKTYLRNDAAPFAYIGIPSLNFYAYNGYKHNHVPSDILENINRKTFERNANLFFNVAYELSQGDYQGRTKRSRQFRFDVQEKKPSKLPFLKH
ncbi:MAG: M28 family peptidase [Bacteroidales bacterium]|nr:M28 family peptidase [Bacteroidales bacterium]